MGLFTITKRESKKHPNDNVFERKPVWNPFRDPDHRFVRHVESGEYDVEARLPAEKSESGKRKKKKHHSSSKGGSSKSKGKHPASQDEVPDLVVDEPDDEEAREPPAPHGGPDVEEWVQDVPTAVPRRMLTPPAAGGSHSGSKRHSHSGSKRHSHSGTKAGSSSKRN